MKEIGYGVDVTEQADKVLNALGVRDKPRLQKLESIPNGLKYFWNDSKTKRLTKIFGAAGEDISGDIPVSHLKEMTDPYSGPTRIAFRDLVYDDPIASPAFEKRINSSYEDGFELILELAEMYDDTGRQLDEDMAAAKLESVETEYLPYLQILRNWSDSQLIDLESRFREGLAASLDQGRTAVYFTPGLKELAPGQLPQAMETINSDDLGNPIVDTALTHKMVGVKTNWKGKKFVRADEMVYIVRKMLGLRKENAFFGASLFEPVLAVSRTIKRIYNYDIPEALLASYITKVIFELNEAGTQSMQESKAGAFLTDFLTTGKIAFVINNEFKAVHQVPITTDHNMMDTLESKIADLMLGVIGVPKSMLNREHNLNRDIATIQAIQYVKFVRKPDERIIAAHFEQQILNPLLSHLANTPLSQMPVRVKIQRIQPDDGELVDSLAAQKEEEINSEKIAQPDAESNTFGAAGETYTVKKIGDEYVVTK